MLDELLDTSSIYWHGAGIGENLRDHPERFEHFGISVVEAMSAGLVPVVFGAAGPAEVIEDGRSGVLVDDLAGFVAATEVLVADDARRFELSDGAHLRAVDFGRDAFALRLHALVDELVGGSPAERRTGEGLGG